MGRRSRDERDRAATRPLADTIRNAGRAAVALAAVLCTMALPGSAFGAAKGIETEISWGGVSSATQTQDANASIDARTVAIAPMAAECGTAPWESSYSNFVLLPDDRIAEN